MQLVDIGINLTHDSYDADRMLVMQRAAAAGVAQMVITGSSLDSSAKAAQLAQTAPGVLSATAGVHPHHAGELERDDLADLRRTALLPQVVAVGECGLDYFRDLAPRAAQRRAFEWQLAIAVEIRKPVFLHQRDAHDDFVAILREYRDQLSGAVAHCFTAGGRELEAYLELGLHIGITGWICDERRGLHLRELMRSIPTDRLLLETDGPYLLPRDLRPMPKSRRNEPMYLPHIAAVVAAARAESLATVADHTSACARRLFALPCV